MTEERAQEIIILSTFVTLASTSGAELKGIKKAKNLHPSRTIIGGFFAMLGCSVLAEVAPDAGAYLAILVAGAAFFAFGLPTIESLSQGIHEGKYQYQGAKTK